MDNTIPYRCSQQESSVLYGDGDPININAKFRLINEVAVGDAVIEQWDGHHYRGESRWIVNAKSLSPWSQLPYVQLAEALSISEDEGKILHNLAVEYNATIRELDQITTRIIAKIGKFNSESQANKLSEFTKFLLAGSPLDKLLISRVKELQSSIQQKEGGITSDASNHPDC